MRRRTVLVVGVVAALSSSLAAVPVAAQESTREVWPFFEGPDAHTWFVNDYDSRYRFTCPSDDSTMRAWAIWSWPGTPAGRYRVEVYVPPQEATAIVTYRIGTDSSGLITDPVRLNQLERRGTWATIFDGDYAGGRLWVELGDHDSEPSGGDDWCRWGGHRSIGAGPARLVRVGTPEPSQPDAPLESDLPSQATVVAIGGQNELSVSWWADSGSPILWWELERIYPDESTLTDVVDGWEMGVSLSGQPPGELLVGVRACNEYGCGPWGGDTATVTAPPQPPGQATVVVTGYENALSVSWSADSGSLIPILWWELEWTYPDGSSANGDFEGGTRSLAQFELPAGEHVLGIRACNEHGCGPWGSDTAIVTAPLPPASEGPTRDSRVEMSLGANNSGAGDCPYSQLPCRWVDVTLHDFPAGSYPVRCVWLHSESGAERVSTSRTIEHGGGAAATLNNVCHFNVRVGRSVHVTVGDVRSNTVTFTGDPSGGSPAPTPPPPPAGELPGAPRLSVRIDESSDGRTLVATWSPPPDDGGSPITGYEVTITRPGRTFGPYDKSASARSHRLPRLRDDTTYTVRVVAKNRFGTGPEARDSDRSPPQPPSQASDVIEFDAIVIETPPRARDTKPTEVSSRSSGWLMMYDNCGFWNCSDHYYVSVNERDTATWYMGDLQGVFELQWLNPKDKISHLDGYAVWEVYEQRTGSNNWRPVKTIRPVPQSEQTRDKWTFIPNQNIELDGRVKIEVSHDQSETIGRIGIRRVRLDMVDVLPELRDAAIYLCKRGVYDAVPFAAAVGASPLAVAAATILVAVGPATARVALSYLGLTHVAKLIKASLIKYGANWGLEKLGIGIRIPTIGDLVAYLKDKVGGWAEDISATLVETGHFGCSSFYRPFSYAYGITYGYGNYADDVAKLYGRRR